MIRSSLQESAYVFLDDAVSAMGFRSIDMSDSCHYEIIATWNLKVISFLSIKN
jgi:hypothetical protein